MQRFGNWNAKNTELWEETQRLGGNKYREIYLKLMEKSHEQKTTEFYAHDYRAMKLSEDDLYDMLTAFAEALTCDHVCTSNCRREGCNCKCGEHHF
jgi:aspartokinase